MFTDDELEAAILRFLTSEVATPRTEAGTRDVVTTKRQVYELIAAAFMLRPVAFFSVCWLASNNLRALVTAQLEDMQAILDAAPRVSKSSLRVESVTELRNAEAALISMTAAFAARRAGVAGGIGPVIQRFAASVGRFIETEIVKNTVVSGDVVETPEELQALIAERWQSARERHAEITTLLGRLIGALDAYTAVRLPDTVVSSLLAKVQDRLAALTTEMAGSAAAQGSRSAMLELTAMRVLLQQAAGFRTPTLRKAPLPGDSSIGLLGGSTGIAAGVLGAVSGPFNYVTDTALLYSVGGVPGTVVLPASSQATLRSRDLTSYVDPPALSEVAIRVDGSGTTSMAAAAWGTGAAAAIAMTSGLTGVAIVWDGARLVLSSLEPGDTSALEVLTDTPGRSAFATWFLGEGAPLKTRGVPVAGADVVAAFTVDARVQATLVQETWLVFTGVRDEAAHDVVQHRVAQGTLVADGTTVVRASIDLEGLGLVAGMRLCVTDPIVAVRDVIAVTGGTAVLDTALDAETYLFYGGPDYTELGAGVRVVLSGTADYGLYRSLGGAVAELHLDRDLTIAGEVQVVMQREHVRLDARAIASSATLTIDAGDGATALGFTPATYVANLDEFDSSIDLAARGVEPGDTLSLTLGSGLISRTILSVVGTKVRFTPPLPYESGSKAYSITNALVEAYLALRVELLLVQSDNAFADAAALDTTMDRLARGARYAGALETTLTGYIAALLELVELVDAYVVPRDDTIEQALRLMVEHGFDRAIDLFVDLELEEFFALDADGVSYRTWLMRRSMEMSRVTLPTSKSTTDPTATWRTLAVQPTAFDPSQRS